MPMHFNDAPEPTPYVPAEDQKGQDQPGVKAKKDAPKDEKKADGAPKAEADKEADKIDGQPLEPQASTGEPPAAANL